MILNFKKPSGEPTNSSLSALRKSQGVSEVWVDQRDLDLAAGESHFGAQSEGVEQQRDIDEQQYPTVRLEDIELGADDTSAFLDEDDFAWLDALVPPVDPSGVVGESAAAETGELGHVRAAAVIGPDVRNLFSALGPRSALESDVDDGTAAVDADLDEIRGVLDGVPVPFTFEDAAVQLRRAGVRLVFRHREGVFVRARTSLPSSGELTVNFKKPSGGRTHVSFVGLGTSQGVREVWVDERDLDLVAGESHFGAQSEGVEQQRDIDEQQSPTVRLADIDRQQDVPVDVGPGAAVAGAALAEGSVLAGTASVRSEFDEAQELLGGVPVQITIERAEKLLRRSGLWIAFRYEGRLVRATTSKSPMSLFLRFNDAEGRRLGPTLKTLQERQGVRTVWIRQGHLDVAVRELDARSGDIDRQQDVAEPQSRSVGAAYGLGSSSATSGPDIDRIAEMLEGEPKPVSLKDAAFQLRWPRIRIVYQDVDGQFFRATTSRKFADNIEKCSRTILISYSYAEDGKIGRTNSALDSFLTRLADRGAGGVWVDGHGLDQQPDVDPALIPRADVGQRALLVREGLREVVVEPSGDCLYEAVLRSSAAELLPHEWRSVVDLRRAVLLWLVQQRVWESDAYGLRGWSYSRLESALRPGQWANPVADVAPMALGDLLFGYGISLRVVSDSEFRTGADGSSEFVREGAVHSFGPADCWRLTVLHVGRAHYNATVTAPVDEGNVTAPVDEGPGTAVPDVDLDKVRELLGGVPSEISLENAEEIKSAEERLRPGLRIVFLYEGRLIHASTRIRNTGALTLEFVRPNGRKTTSKLSSLVATQGVGKVWTLPLDLGSAAGESHLGARSAEVEGQRPEMGLPTGDDLDTAMADPSADAPMEELAAVSDRHGQQRHIDEQQYPTLRWEDIELAAEGASARVDDDDFAWLDAHFPSDGPSGVAGGSVAVETGELGHTWAAATVGSDVPNLFNVLGPRPERESDLESEMPGLDRGWARSTKKRRSQQPAIDDADQAPLLGDYGSSMPGDRIAAPDEQERRTDENTGPRVDDTSAAPDGMDEWSQWVDLESLATERQSAAAEAGELGYVQAAAVIGPDARNLFSALGRRPAPESDVESGMPSGLDRGWASSAKKRRGSVSMRDVST
ncbi:OTU domain-containing protein, partial [Nocardia lijiangensis]|uniref:OTU domain-containing protein n=1 Tax=Nocardia lijiangensis TaxID=299618 RepID=UPI000A88A275